MSFSEAPIQYDEQGRIKITRPINWNKIEDEVDHAIWEKLVTNFWLPEKVPLGNDVGNWKKLTPQEKEAFNKNFAFLTALDTVQGFIGAPQLMQDAVTMHEESVLANISFMERFVKGTELLTRRGWVPIESVGLGTEVAQYSPNNGDIEFVKPVKVFPEEFRSDCIFFTGANQRGVQVVSGGHRIFYQALQADGRWKDETCEALEFTRILNDPLKKVRILTATKKRTVEGLSENSIDHELRLALAFLLLPVKPLGDEHFMVSPINGEQSKFLTKALAQASIEHTLVGEGDIWEVTFKNNPIIETVRNDTLERVFEINPDHKWARGVLDLVELLVGGNHEGKVYVRQEDAELQDFLVSLATLAGVPHQSSYLGKTDDLLFSWDESSLSPYLYGEEISYHFLEEARLTYCVQVPSTYLVTRHNPFPWDVFEGSAVITGNCVHAKSYSSINATFLSSQEIEEAWRWVEQSEYVQYAIKRITGFYYGKDPLRKKAASTLLESFLFYSGFYLPLLYNLKLPQVADLIRLIIRDEAVHGYYIGYKFQRGVAGLSAEEQERLKSDVYALLMELYENQVKLAEELYDPLGYTEDVKAFLHFNANKALMNLGYDPLFPEELTRVSETVRGGLSLTSENHDFFSGAGSSYTILKTENLSDEDFEDMFD